MMHLLGALLCIVIAVIITLILRAHIRRTIPCPSLLTLDKKTIIVTGAAGGIGLEVALECASRGAKVVLGCRDASRAEVVASLIRRKTGNNDVHHMEVDLSSLSSIRQFYDDFVQKHKHLDVLINNAAYMGPSQCTVDGYDRCMQVNFLAAFYISMLFVTAGSKLHHSSTGDQLQRSLSTSHRLRVVNVSSDSYSMGRLDWSDVLRNRRDRGIYESYADSKLAMMLFTAELNSRHSLDGVLCLAAHTGPVKTGLMRNWPGLGGLVLRLLATVLFRDARDGAQTVVYCAAVSDEEANSVLRGRLVVDCAAQDINPVATTVSRQDVEFLWTVASRACGL